MARAEVKDDVYGEDPTVNRLQEECARVAGKEAALFVPSGSMANLVAQLCWVRKGDEVIIGAESHCFRYEVGAGAALAGAQYAVIPGSGLFTAAQVREKIRPRTFHTPGTALVWIENTHNFGGGIVFPLDEIARVKGACAEAGVPLHMDGARVFNACAATGRNARDIAAAVDTLSFCFSKGLGAPVGSVLCGPRGWIDEAKRFRKMVGGGMRQAGILAAAALYALENNVARLGEDHANARFLAGHAAGMKGLKVDMDTVQTNIAVVEVTAGDARLFVQRLKAGGVLINALDARRVRFVTHLDVARADIEAALPVIERAAERLAG